MEPGTDQSDGLDPSSANVGFAPGQPAHVSNQNRRMRASMLLFSMQLRAIIRNGALTITAPDGSRHQFGSGSPSIAVRLADWAVVWRLATNPDLAIGEAFMDGTLVVENASICDFLELCLANLGVRERHWYRRFRALARRFTRRNSVSVARANATHHYDLSDTLYEFFLDADRQYSCAYYLSPNDTLEQAQEQKKRHIAAKLLLRPGQRVLDIGSGWGGFAQYLATMAGVHVTGITLSTEQQQYANLQAANARLTDKVRFRLEDFRQENERYDRVVSVSMFEHVGVAHYREFFAKLSDLLNDDGVALVHTIGDASGPGAGQPWIQKYIFPGGYTPALSEIVPAIEYAGLLITDIEVLRLHYAETLREWRHQFMVNRARVAAIYDDSFCRMWEFYLAGCEAAFRHSGLVVFQIQLSKCIDTIPRTRTYINEWERTHAAAPGNIMEQERSEFARQFQQEADRGDPHGREVGKAAGVFCKRRHRI